MAALSVPLSLLLALPFALQVQPPANDSTYADPILYGMDAFAKNAGSATEVNTGPVTRETLNERLANRHKPVDLAFVYTFSYPHPDMYATAKVDAVRARLAPGEWQCTRGGKHLRADEDRQRCTRQLTPDYFEGVWIITTPRELTFVHSISPGNATDPDRD